MGGIFLNEFVRVLRQDHEFLHNYPKKGTFRERFQKLAAEWKEKSRHMSNTAQMAMLRPYQKIIGMGLEAVPLILEELQPEPDQWFWALEAITDDNPVPPESNGKVKSMATAWIVWGKEHGYIPK